MIDITEVANRAGITVNTARYHHKLATKARRERSETARNLPAPQSQTDGANLWDEDEIAEWISVRAEPARRGAITKSEMREVLAAAQSGNVDQVIAIAQRNLA